MKFVALVALLAMICMAGVVSAQTLVPVSGYLGAAYTIVSVDPGTFSAFVAGDNAASWGTIKVTTNSAWAYTVTGTQMTDGSGNYLPVMGIQPYGGSVVSIPATDVGGAYPAGSSVAEYFGLHQTIAGSEPIGTYSTTLTFTVHN